MRITIPRALPAVAQRVQPTAHRAGADGTVNPVTAIGDQQRRGARGGLKPERPRVGAQHAPKLAVGERRRPGATGARVVDQDVRVAGGEVTAHPPRHIAPMRAHDPGTLRNAMALRHQQHRGQATKDPRSRGRIHRTGQSTPIRRREFIRRSRLWHTPSLARSSRLRQNYCPPTSGAVPRELESSRRC